MRLIFTALRPHVANFDELGEALVQRVHREAVGGIPIRGRSRCSRRCSRQPGVPAAWRTPDFGRTPAPVIPLHFVKDGLDVSYFSLVTTVGTPQDVTLQEIRVESLFPADDATAAQRYPVSSGGSPASRCSMM